MPGREQPHHAPDRGHLYGFLQRERREDAAEPSGEHGLAGSRRPDHDQVVTSRRGDLKGALRPGVAAHVGEIQRLVRVQGAAKRSGLVRGDRALPVQVLESLVERAEGNHGDATHHGRLLGVAGGDKEAMDAAPAAVERDGQHSAHGLDVPVERQLAEYRHVLEALRLEGLGGNEDPQGHGQIEGRADLAHLGRRQVHGDPVHGELEAGIADGGTDTVATLAHRGVGKPNGRERRQSGRDVDLHEDVVGLHAEDGRRPHARQHGPSVGRRPRSVNASNGIQRIVPPPVNGPD